MLITHEPRHNGTLLFAVVVAILCLDFASAVNSEKPKKQNPQQKAGKTRDHLNRVFNQHLTSDVKEKLVTETLQKLLEIYKRSVQPLETVYRFVDLNKDALLEAEIAAKPLVLFVGPWSTGKSTFINYLLDIEDKMEELHTGEEPTTTDFCVLQNGPKYRKITGTQLVSDPNKAFASLEQYGQVFIQRLQGIELKSHLLELVTLVDSPGIIENKKQQQRGYPFSDVMQWFLQRASLIILMFDTSKLEVGSELEVVFNQLKGYEGKLRIVLNKADTLNQQALMKVYGTLFWNMAPLVQSVEPPRVYVGSFWSKSNTNHSLAKLFLKEEETLLQDFYHVIENWVEDKIVYLHRFAFMVRVHALTVDSFLQTYKSNKYYIYDSKDIWNDIVNHPDKYSVFQNLLKQTDISKHDFPDAKTYIQFFSQNQLASFSPLGYYCPRVIGKCDIDAIHHAIRVDIPALLNNFKEKLNKHYCTKETCS